MKAILIFLLLFIVSCKDKGTSQKESSGVVFTIVHSPEGKNLWSLSHRQIKIKEVNGNEVIWDTIWRYPNNLPLKDSTGKVITDSSGKPVLSSNITYTTIGKDSVLWRVEGIHIDSLLKSFKPRK